MGEIYLFVAEIEVEVEEIPEAEQRPKMQHLNQFSVLGRCVFPGKVLSWTEAGGRRWRGSCLAAMAKNEEKKRSLRFSSLGLQLKTLAGSTASTEHSRALDPLCDKEEGAGGERGRRDASQPLPELPCLRPQVLALLTDLRRRLRIDLLPVGAQSLASPRLPQHRSPRSPRALVRVRFDGCWDFGMFDCVDWVSGS